MQKRVETKDVVIFNSKAIAAFKDAARAMTPAERQDAMRGAKRSYADSVVRLAVLFTVCEENGEDSPFVISEGMKRFFRGVVIGRLHPDTAMHLGDMNAMRLLSQLQPSEQQRVAKAGVVEVRKSPSVIQSIPLRNITATDIAKAVDPVTGSVRPAAAQDAQERAPRVSASTKQVCCVLDYADYQALVRLAEDRGATVESVIKSLIVGELAS